jgi:formate C-acetyltransferase
MPETRTILSYAERIERLRAAKQEQTRRKQELLGPMDYDDQGQILPPPGTFDLLEVTSGSGITVRQPILKAFRPVSNHPSGGFFGAKATGENFRRLLAAHPTYINPLSSLCGVYMVSFMSSRRPEWNPDFDYSHLHAAQARYGIDHGIGLVQHFCPDLAIGLKLGWGGLADKIRRYRQVNAQAGEFYDGLEAVVSGIQDWIRRHANDAQQLAARLEAPELKENLQDLAGICERIAAAPPRTFREACQWLVFFQAAAKMYNGSGEWGQMDELLRPYYEQDTTAGLLTDAEAIFHLACLLLTETAYIQLGGPDAEGRDLANPVSFLILEAIHQLKIPANIAVRVGEGLNRELFRRGLEILLADRMGFPKFLGDGPVNEGFMRNGFPLELARQRIYAGCHWTAIPGREYGMCDLIKIELATVFLFALQEMMAERSVAPGTPELWRRFEAHLRQAVAVTAEGIDFHLRHMHAVFPELLLDLFCHGPVERGLDATHGGVEFYNIGVDGASLATVADSFAALEQRLETEQRLTWDQLMRFLETNWAGGEAECARLLMKNLRRFGSGGSRADAWAQRIARTFTALVKEKPTPDGYAMIPGLFSWAKMIGFGKRLGATPDGRRAGDPLSHGPNPTPGFNAGKPGTPTQMMQAVAAVQPGYGNPAPLQLDLDPGLTCDEEAVDLLEALLLTYFDLGGTLVNINVLDRQTLLEACADPSRHPDLIVRVTGFSAYFASLSSEMRHYVLERIV